MASFDSIYQNQRTTIEIENQTSALRHFKHAPRYRTYIYNYQHCRLEVGFVQEIPSEGDRIAEVHHQVWCSTRDEQGLARQGRDFRLIFAQSFSKIKKRQLMDFFNGTQLLLAHQCWSTNPHAVASHILHQRRLPPPLPRAPHLSVLLSENRHRISRPRVIHVMCSNSSHWGKRNTPPPKCLSTKSHVTAVSLNFSACIPAVCSKCQSSIPRQTKANLLAGWLIAKN